MLVEEVYVTSRRRIRARWLTHNTVRITYASGDGTDFPADRPWIEKVLLPQPEVLKKQPCLRVNVIQDCVKVETIQGEATLAEA